MKIEIRKTFGTNRAIFVDDVQVTDDIKFGADKFFFLPFNSLTAEQKTEIKAFFFENGQPTKTAPFTSKTAPAGYIYAKYAGYDAESGESFSAGDMIRRVDGLGWVKADNY